jgi:DNA-binding NtrC family response regulator
LEKTMHVLIVDDEKRMVSLLKGILEEEGYEVTGAESGQEAIDRLKRRDFDVVLTDLRMSPVDGMAVLKESREIQPSCEVVIMTAYASADTAVEAMKAGALDYIIKPFKTEELLLLLQRIADNRSLRDENRGLRRALGERYRFDNIISQSKAMNDVLHQAMQVAETSTTVLLRGESGTGKELIARVIHQSSPRREQAMVRVNSSALPDTLLESELFGHEKGAFTGAHTMHRGKFEIANGGTLFLDEIGDISQAMQVKLLRVLQEKEFDRVGGKQTIKTDARVIAATNCGLEELMQERRFREDLYYRLSVFPVFIPPLRQRREDIPPLVEFFLKKNNRPDATLEPDVLEVLQSYSWPGNVRELENVIERACIVMRSNVMGVKDLPPQLAGRPAVTASSPIHLPFPDEGLDFDQMQRDLILKALEKAEGNKTQAARLLRMSRRKLYSRMESLNIDPESEM